MLTQWRPKHPYAARVGRLNLYFSDELHAALVEQARKVKLSPAALAREHVARGVGFDEGRESDRALRRELAELKRRVAALERGGE